MSRCPLKSKFKIERSCGLNISGLPQSSFHKRPYKPGQHGKSDRRRRVSDYGMQRDALRVLCAFYGNLSFKTVLRYAKESLAAKGDFIQHFIQKFECRLDAAVYWAKWAPTMPAARQLLSHGKCIMLDGKRVDRGYIKVGQTLQLTEAGMRSPVVAQGRASSTREMPSYYEEESEGSIKLLSMPMLSEVKYPCPMKPGLVLKFCRRYT